MGKYCKEVVQACADWVRENGLLDYGGATLRDFCKHFCIDDMTYYSWMKRSEFSDEIKRAKDLFRNRLEKDIVKSLANAAKGYDYDQITTEYTDVNGKPKIKKQVKKTVHIEPNVAASIFLLTNLAPERWKNRQENKTNLKADGTLGMTINHEYTGFKAASSEEEVRERDNIK